MAVLQPQIRTNAFQSTILKMRYQKIFLFAFLLMVVAYCFRRDMHIEKQYTADLTNRLIGARLQMDGKSPYFYRWRPQDGMRYYDPLNCSHGDSSEASIITASPFFHDLMYPLANLSARKVSAIWLALEYILLISCLIMALCLAKNIRQKWLVAIFFSLFLFTEAWKSHVFFGQYYIVFPFLAFVFFLFIRRSQEIYFSFLAGIAFAILILIKPTALLLFLPFAGIVFKSPAKNIFSFFIPIIILAGSSFLHKKQRSFWIEYSKAIPVHMKNHLSMEGLKNDCSNFFSKWDGWDGDLIEKAKAAYPFELNSECFNAWRFEKLFLHRDVSLNTINFISLMSIIIMVVFFYLRRRSDKNISVVALAIFGFSLYMMSEFLSPITRYQYYGAEWVFPLFLLAASYEKKFRWLYILLLIGLLLNILNTPYLKMRHSIGEIIIFIALLCFSFAKRPKNI